MVELTQHADKLTILNLATTLAPPAGVAGPSRFGCQALQIQCAAITTASLSSIRCVNYGPWWRMKRRRRSSLEIGCHGSIRARRYR